MPDSSLAPLVVLAHLAATSAYAGFQATVRFVVYPQFAGVCADRFPAYEAAHQARVSRVVGPLFAALLVTTTGLFAAPDIPRPGALAAAGLLAAVLAVTAFGAVPQHARLSRGFDPAAHTRLLRWDGARLAVALIAVVTAAGLAAAVVTPA